MHGQPGLHKKTKSHVLLLQSTFPGVWKISITVGSSSEILAHQTCSWFTVAQRAGGDSKDKKNFYTVSVPIILPHIPVIPELGASYGESTQEETR